MCSKPRRLLVKFFSKVDEEYNEEELEMRERQNKNKEKSAANESDLTLM